MAIQMVTIHQYKPAINIRAVYENDLCIAGVEITTANSGWAQVSRINTPIC